MKNWYYAEIGPREVLFTRPTTPGVLTKSSIDNSLALMRAHRAYREEHMQFVDWIRTAIPTGNRDYPFVYSNPTEIYRRRDGSPTFATFFNENLDRWYERISKRAIDTPEKLPV